MAKLKTGFYLRNSADKILPYKNRAKKMRAADLSWEAPPSPVKTSISSSAIIALHLRHKRHSVPPKESNACFNFARGCLPQSLHSPQFQSLTRFTLISPSCSVLLFGNDRANCGIGP